MNARRTSSHHQQGFTLLEMSIVIMMLLAFVSMGIYTSRGTETWKRARAASESLRTVHNAQRMYLADHPTFPVGQLTTELLLPYMPNNAPMPTIKSETGAPLGIIVTQFPPVIDAGGGTPYDPSGDTEDSLWDVGR